MFMVFATRPYLRDAQQHRAAVVNRFETKFRNGTVNVADSEKLLRPRFNNASPGTRQGWNERATGAALIASDPMPEIPWEENEGSGFGGVLQHVSISLTLESKPDYFI